MAWSTRELAQLSGTTVNTVRHYHRLGLLEVPERMSNGYKQYDVRHLFRLLQIRRLRDLGVPLAQIGLTAEGDVPSSAALAAVDAELAATIERLQRARAEINAILLGATVADLPAGFDEIASTLSAHERPLMLVYSRLYDEDAMRDVRLMLETERDPVYDDFDDLPPDADDDARAALATRYAVSLRRLRDTYPWLRDPVGRLTMSPSVAGDAFAESLAAVYNPAQVDVLGRAIRIVHADSSPLDPVPRTVDGMTSAGREI